MNLRELEDYLRAAPACPIRDVILDLVDVLERSSHALYVVNGCMGTKLTRDQHRKSAEPDLFDS